MQCALHQRDDRPFLCCYPQLSRLVSRYNQRQWATATVFFYNYTSFHVRLLFIVKSLFLLLFLSQVETNSGKEKEKKERE
jgi:hypothetical protein